MSLGRSRIPSRTRPEAMPAVARLGIEGALVTVRLSVLFIADVVVAGSGRVGASIGSLHTHRAA